MINNFPKFRVTAFLDVSAYPGRFVMSTFIDKEIIIDVWSGLVNATKFCSQFTNKGIRRNAKNFYVFLELDKNRQMILRTYRKLKDDYSATVWKKIYTVEKDLYIIKGQHPSVGIIGGTYVHYCSLVDIGHWCDKTLRFDIFYLVAGIQNYIQYGITSNAITNDAHLFNKSQTMQEEEEESLLPEYEDIKQKGEESSYTILDIIKKLVPNGKYEIIDDRSFICNNILVITEYQHDGQQYQDLSRSFILIISFDRDTSIDFDNKWFTININELLDNKAFLVSFFKKNKRNSSMSDQIDYKELVEEVKQDLNNITIPVQKNVEELLRRRDELVNQLSFRIDLSATKKNIEKLPSRNKRKDFYLHLLNIGKLNELPKGLVSFIYL